jgi:hypothetical protein
MIAHKEDLPSNPAKIKSSAISALQVSTSKLLDNQSAILVFLGEYRSIPVVYPAKNVRRVNTALNQQELYARTVPMVGLNRAQEWRDAKRALLASSKTQRSLDPFAKNVLRIHTRLKLVAPTAQRALEINTRRVKRASHNATTARLEKQGRIVNLALLESIEIPITESLMIKRNRRSWTIA